MRAPLRHLGLAGLCAALFACAQPGPGPVETIAAPADARSHVPDGVPVDYGTPFPTAGLHSEIPAEPGFYDEPQPLPRLVHALEHGNVVIYYGDPGEEAVAQLRAWCERFDHPHQGVVVVPEASLGKAVVLTAWERRQRLERYDQDAAREFIEAFIGQGPEQQH